MICYLVSVALGDACRLQEGQRKGHVQEERRRTRRPLYVRLISSARSLGVCNLLKWSENVCLLQHFFVVGNTQLKQQLSYYDSLDIWNGSDESRTQDEVECWLSVCRRGHVWLFVNVVLFIDCCVLAVKTKIFACLAVRLAAGKLWFYFTISEHLQES